MRGLRVITLTALIALAFPAWPGEHHPLGLPSYPRAADTRFSGELEANQVPVDAAVLTTTDDIETVMDYYHQQFKKRKDVDWVQNWLGPETAYIGYFDVNSGTMRLVTTVSMPSGGTMLIYSSMDPRPLTENKAKVPHDLPSLDEAEEVVTTETSEGGARQRTVGFKVEGLSAKEVERRITENASRLGWKPVSDKLGQAEDMLLFLRGRDRCIIAVRTKKEGEESYSHVTMVVNDRPPDKTSGAKP